MCLAMCLSCATCNREGNMRVGVGSLGRPESPH